MSQTGRLEGMPSNMGDNSRRSAYAGITRIKLELNGLKNFAMSPVHNRIRKAVKKASHSIVIFIGLLMSIVVPK